ncbi:MAG: ornithine cyclodeaminase family protein [Thermoleophilia bacterium]
MTLLLTNDDVRQVLTMPVCLSVLEEAFVDLAEGRAVNRPRSHSYTQVGPDTFYLFKSMDGSAPSRGVHALRLSSDMTHEPLEGNRRVRRKLPVAPGGRWLGLVLLFSLETTELLAIIQDGYLQRMRVGATSGLAAKYLARPEARTVGMLGSGWQAGAQLLALKEVIDLATVCVFSPRREAREAFASEWSRNLEITVEAVDHPRMAIEGVDVVVLATNALQPVLEADWLAGGQHVNSVQGHEVGWDTIRRADVVVVRSKEVPTFQAAGRDRPREMMLRKELPSDLGDRVVELGDVMRGVAGRTDARELTLFGGGGMGGSAGLGIQFAAVGAAVFEEAERRGLGRRLPSDWFLEDLKP